MARRRRKGVLTAAGVAVAVAVSGGALAQFKDPIKDRRAAMTRMGDNLKGIGDFLKGGSDAGMAHTVVLRGEAMAAAAERIPSQFPKGTSLADGVGVTGAKPEIWDQWGKFRKAASTMGELARNLVAAAQIGDKQAIKTALAALGKRGCGGCHRLFRKKLN